MKFAKWLPQYFVVRWRIDKEPFDDIRVRQALNMAIDREDILENYLNGDGEMLHWVVANIPDISDYFTPVDQLPPDAKMLFDYNPERAKELLKEAGYPEGFKTEVVVAASGPNMEIDAMSIVSDYWEAIGVDLTIIPMEGGAKTSLVNNREHKAMITQGHNPSRPESLLQWTWGQTHNYGVINDPLINQAFLDSTATFLTDHEENIRLVKEAILHIYSQAYACPMPCPYQYIGYQPWVKSYTGEGNLGPRCLADAYVRYIWVDQALKKLLTENQ
ncbi:MAG: hypothetical protein JSV32_00720, partial [Dehalococcoidia bacterium]